MPAPAAEVEADGQGVRVTSPDRLIYPATESTPEVTKLQVVEYYASVGAGIMRACELFGAFENNVVYRHDLNAVVALEYAGVNSGDVARAYDSDSD